jgi:hypothetical protein
MYARRLKKQRKSRISQRQIEKCVFSKIETGNVFCFFK